MIIETVKNARSFPVLGWIVLAAVVARLAFVVVSDWDRPVYNFHSNFTAGTLAARNAPIHKFYDTEWFGQKSRELEPTLKEIYHPHPPTTALFFIPLSAFETTTQARKVWTILSIPLLAIIAIGTARLADLSYGMRPWWYALVIYSQPVQTNLLTGQVYILITALIMMFVGHWRRSRDGPFGIMLGTLMAFKMAILMAWPLLFAVGRRRTILVGMASFGIIVFLTWPWTGLQAWTAWLQTGTDFAATELIRVTAFQAIDPFFRHLFTASENFGVPIVALPTLWVRALSAFVILAVLLVSVFYARRCGDHMLALACGILLSLFAMPITQIYSYTLVVISAAILVARRSRFEGAFDWFLLLFGGVTVILHLPFLSPRLWDGWAAVIAYPKLYAAIALWLLCIRLMASRRGKTFSAPATPE